MGKYLAFISEGLFGPVYSQDSVVTSNATTGVRVCVCVKIGDIHMYICIYMIHIIKYICIYRVDSLMIVMFNVLSAEMPFSLYR